MKTTKIKDERVVNMRRKIQSDAFQVLFYGLLFSIIIQEYFFNAPFSQVAVEVVLFIVSGIYIVVANILVGNDIYSSDNKKRGQILVIVQSVVCGLAVGVVNTVLNYFKLGSLVTTNLGNTILISFITFLSTTLVSFVVFEILFLVNRKRQNKIEAEFNKEE